MACSYDLQGAKIAWNKASYEYLRTTGWELRVDPLRGAGAQRAEAVAVVGDEIEATFAREGDQVSGDRLHDSQRAARRRSPSTMSLSNRRRRSRSCWTFGFPMCSMTR